MQHRRHARAHDRRPLPLDPAPGPQHRRGDRLSFPFFFDPGWDAEVRPVPEVAEGVRTEDAQARWDRANVHELTGTYGEYLLAKVSKVFPALTSEL